MNEAPPPSAADAADPLVGQIFHERFKIVALIARGGMGRVYKAEQAPLGRVCAIKVLRVTTGGEASLENFQERFFLEASTCAKLTHPNTVTIFDYGRTDDDVYYMAMEYLEGRTLQKAIGAAKVFDEARAIHITRQICRSLREAHSLGVIHRDLKPANIFLLDNGDEADMVKVLDFGLVKSIDEPAVEELTQAGMFMGSPKYMAPEQIQGEHVDARTDVYAIGVLMFEMITGKVPYERANQLNTVMAHVNDPIPRLRDVVPDLAVTPSLEATIYRCLAKNPAERFASMDELMAAMKHATGDAPSLTGATSLTDSGARAAAMQSGGSFPPHETGAPSQAADVAVAQAVRAGARRRNAVLGAVAFAALLALFLLRRSSIASEAEAAATARRATELAEATKASADAVKRATPMSAPATVVPTAVPAAAISVDSDPPGAFVRGEDRAIICDKTPCTVVFQGDSRIVIVDTAGYEESRVRLGRNDAPRKIALTKKAPTYIAPARHAAAAASTPTDFKPLPATYE